MAELGWGSCLETLSSSIFHPPLPPLNSWDSGLDWTPLGLSGKLASSAMGTERKVLSSPESRNSSPSRWGSRLYEDCEQKGSEITKGPRTQLLLIPVPRERVIWNQLGSSPQHPKIRRELMWGLNGQKKTKVLRLLKVKEFHDPLGGPRPSVRHHILGKRHQPKFWNENPLLEDRLSLSSREGVKEGEQR